MVSQRVFLLIISLVSKVIADQTHFHEETCGAFALCDRRFEYCDRSLLTCQNYPSDTQPINPSNCLNLLSATGCKTSGISKVTNDGFELSTQSQDGVLWMYSQSTCSKENITIIVLTGMLVTVVIALIVMVNWKIPRTIWKMTDDTDLLLVKDDDNTEDEKSIEANVPESVGDNQHLGDLTVVKGSKVLLRKAEIQAHPQSLP